MRPLEVAFEDHDPIAVQHLKLWSPAVGVVAVHRGSNPVCFEHGGNRVGFEATRQFGQLHQRFVQSMVVGHNGDGSVRGA